ncbi:MAG TPA: hypothetical protein VMB04_08990 [Mycobacterium sp.]|nr:hypothetical protein [Mycobacterium sp.]
MSGTPTIPGPDYTLKVGGDNTTPIYYEMEPLTVNSTVAIPDPIVTESTSKSDADIDLKVEPLSVKSDSDIDLKVEPLSVTSDSRSEIDLKPVVVDSCQTTKLAPLPPTRIAQPYSQHFGFTFMGVELFGFTTSGRYETFLNNPEHPEPCGPRHEQSGRLVRPPVIGRPEGISVRVIDSDE